MCTIINASGLGLKKFITERRFKNNLSSYISLWEEENETQKGKLICNFVAQLASICTRAEIPFWFKSLVLPPAVFEFTECNPGRIYLFMVKDLWS